MEKPRVRVYTDYKSPYAFVANKRLFELEEKLGVELEWLPYTLRIPEFMGTVEERTPHFWRKVRYAYMDARRYANAQGLTMKGPRRIYDAFYSSAGMLFAQRHGLFRPYHDTVFRRFWSHDLEIDELSDISGVIASVGGSAKDFEAYVHGPARAEHDRIIDEAEALGVFGVPTMVFNGELFWGGDRIDMLIERIKNPEIDRGGARKPAPEVTAEIATARPSDGCPPSRRPDAPNIPCAPAPAATPSGALRIQRCKFVAKQLQAFHLVFERRQRVRQAPDIDLQPLEAPSQRLRRWRPGTADRVRRQSSAAPRPCPSSARSRGYHSPSTPEASSSRRTQ